MYYYHPILPIISVKTNGFDRDLYSGNGSGWMTSLCTAAPVKETQSCSPSFWTVASQSNSWTVTTGHPFTMHAGELD